MTKLALAFSALAFATSCAHITTSKTSEATPATQTSTLPAAGAATPSPMTAPAKAEAKTTIKSSEAIKSDDSLHPRGIDFGATIKAVAFGSSANQDLAQPIWKTIAENNPDLFLFMGDNVQAAKPAQKPLAEQYRKLDSIPEYRAFREKVPFMAT